MQILTATLSTAHFIDTYRDAERIEGYCRVCPNYARSWSCPPFAYDVEQRLRAYDRAMLVVMKVIPVGGATTWQELEQNLMPERLQFEARLRHIEQQHDALACYPGSCLYCNDHPHTHPGETHCTRCQGTSCRHPQYLRPSLEAYGFDLSRTMTDIFDLPLQWTLQENETTSTDSDATSATDDTILTSSNAISTHSENTAISNNATSSVGDAISTTEDEKSTPSTHYHTYIAAIFHNGDAIEWE